MQDDLSQAVAIALDQICLDNLVLFEGLGTEWSKDRALLAALPGIGPRSVPTLVLAQARAGTRPGLIRPRS